MAYLHEPRVRAAFFVLWCFGWVVISVTLLAPLPVPMPGGSDKLAHFGAFAGIAFAAVSFCHSPRRLALLALLTSAGGVLLEYAQAFVPYRSFDVQDAVADVLGAGAGYVLALFVLQFLIRPADPALREARAARS
jgi:VanZ family protein